MAVGLRIGSLGALVLAAGLFLAGAALARPEADVEARLKTIREETQRAMRTEPPTPGATTIWRVPGVGYEWQDCVNGCPTLVAIPAGQVIVGGVKVTIAYPLGVSKYPITAADWAVCVRAGVCHTNGEFGDFSRGKYPVVNLSWRDAQDYVAWLSRRTGAAYRLLSEAEYRYVNGAGAVTRYWWGDQIGVGFANCVGCGPGLGLRAAPAASFLPNAFGIYDTTGNVSSWTGDVYGDTLSRIPSDGSPNLGGDPEVRVLRGGGWTGDAASLSLDSRAPAPIDARLPDLGLRVARVF
jgi:formylglycine-generating enzyme required for sulfatase activity